MESANINIQLNFNQLVDVIKQLSYKDKIKLTEVLKKETKTKQKQSDPVLTHFASEQVLAKDWALPEEDEAWKDL